MHASVNMTNSLLPSQEYRHMICNGATKQRRRKRVRSTKGVFAWREEDPRRRNNFSFALHAEISVGVVTKWRRKIRKIVDLKQLNARLPSCFFLFVHSTRVFRVKVVYMVLGSSYLSARKILALGPSSTFCM